MTIELRPENAAFAQKVELELLANDWKGGWQNMTLTDLMVRLREEVDELEAECKKYDALKKKQCDTPVSSGDAVFTQGDAVFTQQDVIFGQLLGMSYRIGRESADVGAFSMFIADIYGALD